MSTTPVIVVTGQLAAGKSTVATALARRFPHGVHIDLDGVREMVVSGRASPLEWTDETTRQFRLAIEGAMALAAVYQAAGFAVVIEGGLDPDEARRAAELGGLGPVLTGVSLHPALEVALARNRARTHKSFDTSVLDPVIREIDADLRATALPEGWHAMDNGAEAVEATVDRILALLPEGSRPDQR